MREELLERIVEMTPAYDERDKGYGIHGVDLRMILKGPRGATQFVLYTNWQLPHVARTIVAADRLRPLPADLGYHSPRPVYDGQSLMTDSCPYLDGKPCYYDGSGLSADRIYEVLLLEGSEGVWRELEEYYKEVFERRARE